MSAINKKRTELMLKLFKSDLDDIAIFIKDKTKIDVRENTKSRSCNLPKYRCLFFNIAISVLDINYATLGSYLGKDHATINHAIKMKNNGIINYLLHYKDEYILLQNEIDVKKAEDKLKVLRGDIKSNVDENILQASYNTVIREKDKEIKKLSKDFESYKKQKYNEIQKLKKIIKREDIRKILSLREDELDLLLIRLNPFFKMLNSRVTNNDLIRIQQETRLN